MLKVVQKVSQLFAPTARFLALALLIVFSARIAAAQAYVADASATGTPGARRSR